MRNLQISSSERRSFGSLPHADMLKARTLAMESAYLSDRMSNTQKMHNDVDCENHTRDW